MAQENELFEFKFIPAYADCLAHIANYWAMIEHYIDESIWNLAGTQHALGACITAQIFTLTNRLNALLALLKIRRADHALIDRVNEFANDIRGPQEIRNRSLHDPWLMSNWDSTLMGRMEVTAQKKLSYRLREIPLQELKSHVEIIRKCELEAYAIARAVRDALPALPEIPESELRPIVSHPSDQ